MFPHVEKLVKNLEETQVMHTGKIKAFLDQTSNRREADNFIEWFANHTNEVNRIARDHFRNDNGQPCVILQAMNTITKPSSDRNSFKERRQKEKENNMVLSFANHAAINAVKFLDKLEKDSSRYSRFGDKLQYNSKNKLIEFWNVAKESWGNLQQDTLTRAGLITKRTKKVGWKYRSLMDWVLYKKNNKEYKILWTQNVLSHTTLDQSSEAIPQRVKELLRETHHELDKHSEHGKVANLVKENDSHKRYNADLISELNIITKDRKKKDTPQTDKIEKLLKTKYRKPTHAKILQNAISSYCIQQITILATIYIQTYYKHKTPTEEKELKDIKLNYTDENFGNHITETNNTILKLVNDSHYTQLIDDILTDATSFNYSQSMGVNLRYTKIGLKYYNEQFDSNFKTFKKEKKNLEAMLGKKYKSSTIIAKKHKIEKVSERLLRDCESMSDKYGIISDTLRKFINENTIPTPIKKKENEKLREKLKKLDDKLTPQGNGTDEPPLQLSQLNDMVLNLRNKLIAQEHDQIRQELEDDNWEGAANDSRFLFDFLQKEDDKKRQRELLKAITENTATAEKNAKDRVTNAGVAEVNETDKKKNEQDKEQIKTEKQKFEDEKSNWQRIRR
jgi:hypothetical protein